MLWKFNSVYNPELQIADHNHPVKYEISMPPARSENFDRKSMYIHSAHGRTGRQIDNTMEQFVDDTRMGAAKE
jgi:hopanoid C-3 methylase